MAYSNVAVWFGQLRIAYKIKCVHLRIYGTVPGRINVAQSIIAALLTCGTLYVASRLLVPLVVSVLAYLALRPAVRRLCGCGAPPALASGLVIAALLGVLAGTITLIVEPAQHWLTEAPQSAERLRTQISEFDLLHDARYELASIAESTRADPLDIEVEVRKPSMVDEVYLVNQTGQILALVGAIGVLTFFLLATGDDLLNRLLHVLPTPPASVPSSWRWWARYKIRSVLTSVKSP